MRSFFLAVVITLLITGCVIRSPPADHARDAILMPGDLVHITFIKLGHAVADVDLRLDDKGDLALPLGVSGHLAGVALLSAGEAIRQLFGPDGPTEVVLTRR